MKERRRLTSRNILCAVLALVCGAAAAADRPGSEVTNIARQAFVWGYPVVDNYAVLDSFALEPGSPGFKAPLNAISHARDVAGPGDRTIIAPNVDTPYSYAWLDLRAEPIVLTIPPFEKDRYVSLQLIDAYTYILGYVTPRTNGNEGGAFLVAGPGWSGEVPKGITAVFRADTDIVLAHYRTQILGPGDLARLHQLQDQYGVQPLSAWLGVAPPPPAPALKPIAPADVRKEPESMQFFRVLNWMLELMPTLPEERDLRARFTDIGIGAGLAFDPDAETQAAIAEGMKQGLAEMQARARTVTSSAELFGSREFLGRNYLIRAVAAMIGIYGNSAEEFLGVGYASDANGAAFDGRKRYTIAFAADRLPDVGAFWSITIYTRDRFIYANPLNRYSISSGMIPDLAKNADGGFTIYVQHDEPAPERKANWLPVPDDAFIMTFRTYVPGPSIRDGLWRAPPVVPTE
jgi:hypothetical protein